MLPSSCRIYAIRQASSSCSVNWLKWEQFSDIINSCHLFIWNQLPYKQCLLLLPYKHEAFVEIVWHKHGSSVGHLSTRLKLRLALTCRRFVKTLEHGWFWSLWSWFKASQWHWFRNIKDNFYIYFFVICYVVINLPVMLQIWKHAANMCY